MVGAVIIIIIAIGAIIIPYVSPYTYDKQDLANNLLGPSWQHLLDPY